MARKNLLPALISISALLFVLPAGASAQSWHLEPAGDFTVKGGEVKFTTAAATLMTCTSATGSGTHKTSTEGTVQFVLHGCKAGLFSCTSPMQPTGTVRTEVLPFHYVLLEANPQTPGIQYTPSGIDDIPDVGEGPFAQFTCFGIQTTVQGNGLIGDLTTPKCGEMTKSATLSLSSSGNGIQQWMQITTTGTKYDLTSKSGMGDWTTISVDASLALSYNKEGKLNCTF